MALRALLGARDHGRPAAPRQPAHAWLPRLERWSSARSSRRGAPGGRQGVARGPARPAERRLTARAHRCLLSSPVPDSVSTFERSTSPSGPLRGAIRCRPCRPLLSRLGPLAREARERLPPIVDAMAATGAPRGRHPGIHRPRGHQPCAVRAADRRGDRGRDPRLRRDGAARAAPARATRRTRSARAGSRTRCATSQRSAPRRADLPDRGGHRLSRPARASVTPRCWSSWRSAAASWSARSPSSASTARAPTSCRMAPGLHGKLPERPFHDVGGHLSDARRAARARAAAARGSSSICSGSR